MSAGPGACKLPRMMSDVAWEPAALERLKKVPFFIRPWVRRRAETVAKERGLAEVTSSLLDDIKNREHRG